MGRKESNQTNKGASGGYYCSGHLSRFHIELSFFHLMFIPLYLHFQSKPLMIFVVFATVHNLMNGINLIDNCQAHLPKQYASNIEFIRQK